MKADKRAEKRKRCLSLLRRKTSLLKSLYADIRIDVGSAYVCGFTLNGLKKSKIPLPYKFTHLIGNKSLFSYIFREISTIKFRYQRPFHQIFIPGLHVLN